MLITIAGLLLLYGVWSDRDNIKTAWKTPTKWFPRTPDEIYNSRRPSQPFNLVIGTVLGVAAVTYGVVSLVR